MHIPLIIIINTSIFLYIRDITLEKQNDVLF